MSASADVLALASAEFDISGIEKGNTVTFKWRGKPVFVRHRTEHEVELAQIADHENLPDPQLDRDRIQVPEWYVDFDILHFAIEINLVFSEQIGW